jgi:cell fate (sporulation/competence/biofilm development) regulator YmcA (YheA/YmcA/DUF963 family)
MNKIRNTKEKISKLITTIKLLKTQKMKFKQYSKSKSLSKKKIKPNSLQQQLSLPNNQ